MIQKKQLEKYCKSRLLHFKINEGVLELYNNEAEISSYLIVDSEQLLFDEELNFLPELDNANLEIDGFVYLFGGRWYTQEINSSETELKELVYRNEAVQKLPTKSFLGIHSGYELMNGMGLYRDWIKKAKFLGADALGICERNTLAGALVFQNGCKEAGVKSIIGMSFPVQGKEVFDIKCYARDFQGWLNLLKFNTIINVDQKHTISLSELQENREGLFLIADPKSMNFAETEDVYFDFYQLETTNFLNEDKDRWFIDNLGEFLNSDIKPISITDAYYLEKEDFETREALWSIGKAFDDNTNNQYFKSKTEYAAELIQMFEKGSNGWVSLFKEAVQNEAYVVENCNFEYDTDTRHLPKYIMTKEESEEFDSNEELFLHRVKQGFKKRGITEPQAYLDRLKVEIEVLKQGDVIDYFLSLYDIIQYARSEKMLIGIGRGSAGGSLVAYLLEIIEVNPLEFDLLFERFLNSGRMGEYEDRPSFKLELDNGTSIDLAEGALVRVLRNGKERVCQIETVIEGDEVLRY